MPRAPPSLSGQVAEGPWGERREERGTATEHREALDGFEPQATGEGLVSRRELRRFWTPWRDG